MLGTTHAQLPTQRAVSHVPSRLPLKVSSLCHQCEFQSVSVDYAAVDIQ
jgi:hypothetical protein